MATSKNTYTGNPNDRGCSSKRPRTVTDTGSYDPIISAPSECRAKRIKILKQKRAATTGISCALSLADT